MKFDLPLLTSSISASLPIASLAQPFLSLIALIVHKLPPTIYVNRLG